MATAMHYSKSLLYVMHGVLVKPAFLHGNRPRPTLLSKPLPPPDSTACVVSPMLPLLRLLFIANASPNTVYPMTERHVTRHQIGTTDASCFTPLLDKRVARGPAAFAASLSFWIHNKALTWILPPYQQLDDGLDIQSR